jgi:2-polyprenyl-6-methoxyphenol hydroxylase-like FAD-dependent oxidoreductase
LEQNEKEVRVRFSNGEEATFDFVAGCDGIHSQTRQLLFGNIPLEDTGWAGWAWWIDPKLTSSDTIQEYWGGSHFLGIYPAKDKTCCFSAFPFPKGRVDDAETRPERIQSAFGNFGGVVPNILETLPGAGQINFTRFADIKLEKWHKGRVLLLGDAGQGILPTAGIGATMAMESAAVLADELRRADASTVPIAIDYFVKRRRQRVDHVQVESRNLAHLMFTESALKSWLVRRLMKFYSLKQMLKGFSRTLEESF